MSMLNEINKLKKYKRQPVYKPSSLAYDHTGSKFGKLTIMHAIGVEGVHTMWRARCECGTEVKVRSHQLNAGAGKITSCGKCENLPRYNFIELPHDPIPDDGQIAEQVELPLEKEIDAIFDGAAGNRIPEGGYDAPDPVTTAWDVAEHEKPYKVTAWDVAGECCGLLNRLDHADKIKAVQLIKVELGYDL